MANKRQKKDNTPAIVLEKRTLRVRTKPTVIEHDDESSDDSDFVDSRKPAAKNDPSDEEEEEVPLAPPKKANSNKKPPRRVKVPQNVLIEQQETLKAQECIKKPERNILRCLDSLLFGPRKEFRLNMKTVQNAMVYNSVKNLKVVGADYAGKFSRRITSLAWHEKYPYALACASKFGDILFLSGVRNESDCTMRFQTKVEIEGSGAGGSITAMKFHNENMNLLYRSSIDCTVAKVDLSNGENLFCHNTGDYNRWFCSLDVNFQKQTLFAGDNKGVAYQFSLDGKLVNEWNFQKDKIHHLEFSKKDPNLLVSTSLDKKMPVKIWDIRSLRKNKELVPLHSLEHNVGVNCARFSPLDGSRLLTSDQLDEIRVYQGPLWKDYLVIKHHHKQFQHITPIKADWHPVNDYIVIGRYPKGDGNASSRSLRAVEFFDSYSGDFVEAIYPPLDEICSLNAFNPTGEYLATGMNSKLIIWKPSIPSDASDSSKLGAPTKASLSQATRNQLRGRQAREYSPASSDDENDANGPPNKKKRSGKTAAAATKAEPAATKKPTARKKK